MLSISSPTRIAETPTMFRTANLSPIERLYALFLVIHPALYVPLSADPTTNYLFPKFALFLIWVLCVGVHVQQSGVRSRFRRSDILLLMLLTWLGLSQALNGQGPVFLGARYEGLLTTLALFATYVLTRETAHLIRWPVLLRLWPIYLAIPVAAALGQFLFPEGQFAIGATEGREAVSTFGNRAAFAALLMLFLPVAVLQPMRPAWLQGALMACLGFGLAIAQSRATWGAVAGMLALLIWISVKQSHNLLRPVVLSALLGLAGFGAGLSVPDAARDQHHALPSGRGIFWPIAVQGILEKPFLGWGTGGYAQAFSTYANWKSDPAVRAAILGLAPPAVDGAEVSVEQTANEIYIVERVDLGKVGYESRSKVSSDKAHNEYLDLAVQYGLPYAVLWLGWLLSVCRSGWSASRRDTVVTGLIVSVAGLLAYLTFWMSSSMFLPLVYIFLGVIAGWGEARARRSAESRREAGIGQGPSSVV